MTMITKLVYHGDSSWLPVNQADDRCLDASGLIFLRFGWDHRVQTWTTIVDKLMNKLVKRPLSRVCGCCLIRLLNVARWLIAMNSYKKPYHVYKKTINGWLTRATSHQPMLIYSMPCQKLQQTISTYLYL